ncbi:MAG TPA: maleylpyruvate isomerase family mycothiol-dependent enzyme [Candidatus Nanopelagicales bacterium]|jgi:uncharacterized protein (TIGR03083 family)
MNDTVVDVGTIPALEHEEAMDLADAELGRLLDAVDALRGPDWARPTECAGWDVRAMLGHLLGMLELQADADERVRQITIATQQADANGGLRLDAMTALQVREHAPLSTEELRTRLHTAAKEGLAARRSMPSAVRAAPYDPGIPGVSGWTIGYVCDVIHTRDPWLHRMDLSRAIARDPVLTGSHDGRIVADVVAEWAATHGRSFTLDLTGPAGGHYQARRAGRAGAPLRLDAVDFCRTLSGRADGTGLLMTRVTF